MSTDETLAAVGRRVRVLRDARGLTQADLAVRVGLSRSSIANLEAGRQNLPLGTVTAVAAELSTTVGALLGETSMPDLPKVDIVTVHRTSCATCGNVGEDRTQPDAVQRRAAHLRGHLTGLGGVDG